MAGIRIEWAQFGDFDGFDVLRSDSPMDINALPSPIATDLKTMYYADTAVVEGATYYYRIAALRDGIVKVSSEIKATVRAGDEHWDKVVLLCRFDGSGNDLSTLNHVPTYAANVSYSTTAKWGESVEANGFGDKWIKYTGSDFGFAANENFTVDGWVRLTAKPTGYYFSPFGSWAGNAGWCIFFRPGGINFNFEQFYLAADINYSADQWYHIAVSRKGGIIYLFLDGILIATQAYSQAISNQDLFVGGNRTSTDWWRGYVDEFRITKGVCRYDSNFTVPDEPFLDR